LIAQRNKNERQGAGEDENERKKSKYVDVWHELSASCQIEFYFLNFNFKIINNLFRFSSKFENNDKTNNKITYKFL